MPDSNSKSGSGSAGWTPPATEELHALLPQYEIESLIGHGGMGAVYRGRQAALDRPVAIKLLPETLAAQDDGSNFVERFKLEARSMAGLDHPAIISVHDFGQTSAGHLYFVMEFIDGMDMSKYIQLSGGKVEADTAVAIVSHVLDALDYAHSKGIVHRDIKPANVLINRDGKVKIADFGLAKKLTGEDEPAVTGLTMSNVALGTPDFIAPEALDPDATPDHRADLYAVGIMLYQMLTGKVPRGLFRLPSEENDELDPRIDEILTLAMESDPGGRFQSATEFRLKLDELASAPVEKIETDLPSEAIEAPAEKFEFTEPGLRHSQSVRRHPPKPRKKSGGAGPIVGTVIGSLAVGAVIFWLIVGGGKEEEPTGLNVVSDPVESEPSVEASEDNAGWIELITEEGLADWSSGSNSEWSFENGEIWKRKGLLDKLSKPIDFGELEIEGEFWTSPTGNGGVMVKNVAEICLTGSRTHHRDPSTGGIWGVGQNFGKKAGPEVNPIPDNTWVKFRGRFASGLIETWIDGKKISEIPVGSPPAQRGIVLQSTGEGDVAYRNLRVRPIREGGETRDSSKEAAAQQPIVRELGDNSTGTDWPTGPHFSQEGHYKAWSSIPNDPLLDLSRLRGFGPARQVYFHGNGWIVLGENGETISSAGEADRKGILKISPVFDSRFSLITEKGEVLSFDRGKEIDVDHFDRVGFAREGLNHPAATFAINGEGSLFAWGKKFDGSVKDQWKQRPELAEGEKAEWLTLYPGNVVAVALADGGIRMWTDVDGEIQLSEEVKRAVSGGNVVARYAIRGIPVGGGPIRTFKIDSGEVAEHEAPTAEAIFITRNSNSIFCIYRDGTVGFTAGQDNFHSYIPELPGGVNPLEHIRNARPDLVSIRTGKASMTSDLTGSLLWYDGPQADDGPSLTIAEESGAANVLASNAEPGNPTAPSDSAASPAVEVVELVSTISSHQNRRRSQLSELLKKYQSALDRAGEAAINAGELDRVEAIQTATERAGIFADSIAELSGKETVEPLPTLPPLGSEAPDELKRLRGIFDKEVEKIESNLMAQFVSALETLQSNLVRQDRVEEAKSLMRYRSSLSGTTPADVPVPSKSAEEWISLGNGRDFKGWTPENAEGWEVKDGAILCSGGRPDMISIPIDWREFELEGEIYVTRDGNGGIFFLSPPPGGKARPEKAHEMAIVGSGKKNFGNVYTGGVYGSGGAGSKNVSPSESPLADDTWGGFRLVVANGRIEAWIEGRKTAELPIVSPSPVNSHLVLQGLRSGGTVGYRNLRIRPVGRADVAGKDNSWTDLLAQIDPVRDRSTRNPLDRYPNRWSIDGGELVFPDSNTPGEILLPGTEGIENFEMEIEFTRKSGVNGFDVKIPAQGGGTPVVVAIKSANGKFERTTLKSINKGEGVDAIEFPIESGRRTTLKIIAKATGSDKGITLLNNDETLINWKGDYRTELGSIPDYQSDQVGIWLYASSEPKTQYSFHTIRFREIQP